MNNRFYLTVLFSLIILLTTGCGASKKSYRSAKAKQIHGLWEVKAVHNSNEDGYKRMPRGMFKMILEDGRFFNFMTTESGALITVDGTYRLDGDHIYTEEINHSFNVTQIGKDNPLELKLTGDKFMYLRWYQAIDEFGTDQNRWVEEIWQRVEIEDLEVSRIDLEQELRTLVKDPGAIKEVIE